MRYIRNFLRGDPISVQGYVSESFGNMVAISQSLGSINFHHAMTPEQAIEMADALLEAAASLQHGVLTVPAKVASHAE